MNEKEKMMCGEMYFPGDSVLVTERFSAKTLCQKYNQTLPQESEKRKSIIKNLFGKIGKNFQIEPSFQCDYGYNIEAGDNFYSNHNLVILDPAKVIFGNNVLIGPNCGFYTAEHPVNAQERLKGLELSRPIIVGNNVWFGGGVTVLSGVKIGDNVVIGAGSVVKKDLPSDTICVGNPCKPIKAI